MLAHHKALEELDHVNQILDWSRIECHFSHIHNKTKGEQGWPPIMMFKLLLLQAWYGLGDEALEKQLARDLVFKRFVDLSLDERVPDHSTIWRFRNRLEDEGLFEQLLNEINDQLAAQSLIITQGTVSIVDATVIEAKNCRPRKGVSGNNTQDPEAGYNIKTVADGKRKTTYGYKAHVNTDEDGFIKCVTYTPGNTHDSTQLDALVTQTEKELYADKAYKSQKHDELLNKHHIKNRILNKAVRNKPLTDHEKKQNKEWSSTRSIVERVFGVLKLHYGIGKGRYIGLARNRSRFMMCAIAYNMKRGAAIQSGCT